ncbi:MAG: HD domain-containing protein [Lachnospirales bacterium]
MDKLKTQMEFLIEVNKLKSIFRQSMLPEDRRFENDAEHSWHMCMYAIVLEEYAPDGIDMLKCLKMLLIHDLVEIYAGDTYLYDEKGYEDKLEREKKAADKLYGILGKQGDKLKELWYEFENCESEESMFANALDRLQPILLNYLTQGEQWIKHNVNISQVIEKGKWKTRKVDEKIRQFVFDLLNDAVKKGYLGGN